MVQALLSILVCYAFCVLFIPIAYRMQRKPLRKVRHYVLYTHNNQMEVEWYIRGLLFSSWIRGRELKISVMDEGSTDETLAIVERFAIQRPIHVSRAASSNPPHPPQTDDEFIPIRLDLPEDIHKLPFVH